MLKHIDDDKYISDSGETIQREFGLSPEGNKLWGEWVYRDSKGNWIDYKQYRYDLFEKYGFKDSEIVNEF